MHVAVCHEEIPMHRMWLALAGTFVMSVGCSHSAPAADPSKPEASAGSETTASAARLAAPEDLEVSVQAATPVGPVMAQHADEYRVQVALTNRSRHPIALGDATAIVSVMRGATQVAGCDGARASVSGPSVLPPGGTVWTTVPVRCAMEQPGQYDIVAVVAPNPDDEVIAPHEVRRSGSTRVVVVEGWTPVASDAVPTAPIYSPDVGGLLPGPAPRDVRPIE